MHANERWLSGTTKGITRMHHPKVRIQLFHYDVEWGASDNNGHGVEGIHGRRELWERVRNGFETRSIPAADESILFPSLFVIRPDVEQPSTDRRVINDHHRYLILLELPHIQRQLRRQSTELAIRLDVISFDDVIP